MPLDRHAKRFLDMLAIGGEATGPYENAGERREALSSLAAGVEDDPTTVDAVTDTAICGDGFELGLRFYTPLNAPAGLLPGLVFLHGGGWVAGGLDTHDGVCRRLANASGCKVICVDYRLAPEHPFPTALEDGLAALAAVARDAPNFGIDPAAIGIGGDSAGGGLAAAICQIARDDGSPDIAFQLLICPIVDVRDEAPSRIELAEGYFLSRATMQRDLELYCPGADRADPRLSPLRAASLAGLPPAIVHTAEFDPFRDEGQAYALRLIEAGVPVRNQAHAGMIHYFYAMPRMIPHAAMAMTQIGAEVAAVIASLR